MAAAQAMKRIPRIRFPRRHSNSSARCHCFRQFLNSWVNHIFLERMERAPNYRNQRETSSESQLQQVPTAGDIGKRSEIPVATSNSTVGGKASLQPKRTPVSDKEIEAILLGGCF